MNKSTLLLPSFKKTITSCRFIVNIYIEKESLLLLLVVVIVICFLEPLEMIMSKSTTKLKGNKYYSTFRNGSLAFLTFLLISLSTYFLLTWVPHWVTTSSSKRSFWYKAIRILGTTGKRSGWVSPTNLSMPPKSDFWCFSEVTIYRKEV